MATRTAIPPKTLAADARNRALRTLLQVAAPALIVALQAAIAWAGGGAFDWHITLGAAIVALVAPVLAFLQRIALDPTGLPSATPPTDPIVAAKVRADRRALGLSDDGHARIGTLAGVLLVLAVILLAFKVTYWLTGSLAVVVVVLFVLAFLL